MVDVFDERLTESIDVANVTLKPFEGFIFVCGGPHTSDTGTLASARHYALIKSKASGGMLAGCKVVLAEHMTTLLQGSDFDNLLEFEEHIAALSACVIIFVESPGSIAELGSFSVMKDLSQKLLVVCEQKFETNENPSFIFLGPIATLRRERQQSVQVFPMCDASNMPSQDLLDDCWDILENEILKAIKRPIKESILDVASLSHQMILIVSLLSLYVGLRQGELELCLEKFGISISSKALKRHLRMLEKVNLINSRTYGHEIFYFSLNDNQLLILRPKKSSTIPFDYSRFKVDIIDVYDKYDSRKRKAIKAFMRERSYS